MSMTLGKVRYGHYDRDHQQASKEFSLFLLDFVTREELSESDERIITDYCKALRGLVKTEEEYKEEFFRLLRGLATFTKIAEARQRIVLRLKIMSRLFATSSTEWGCIANVSSQYFGAVRKPVSDTEGLGRRPEYDKLEKVGLLEYVEEKKYYLMKGKPKNVMTALSQFSITATDIREYWRDRYGVPISEDNVAYYVGLNRKG